MSNRIGISIKVIAAVLLIVAFGCNPADKGDLQIESASPVFEPESQIQREAQAQSETQTRSGQSQTGAIEKAPAPISQPEEVEAAPQSPASVERISFNLDHRQTSFNRDWKFAKGEQSGAEAPNFDDSSWQAVRLPHDWAISGPFNPKENGYAGKLPWKGVGWYRKTFTLDKADNGKRVYFDFDGIMAFLKVYVNGQLAGEWDYGYMSFRVDATPYIKFGGYNIIAVRVDTRQHGTRWYPGAGIYRKVTMTICEPVHIAHWGIYVTTPDVSDKQATVAVRSTIENHLDTESKISVEIVLLGPDGQQVAMGKKDDVVPAGASREVDQSFAVANPQRWDITSPKLYTAKTIVRIGDKITDTDVTFFGIRTFKFTANDGFHLNGRRVQLYGVCLHHDHGPLGAAFYTRAMERQLEIMRDMGVNAIRTSHNPSAPELLDLCDQMGFVVWDECFDKWDRTADRIDGKPPLEEYGEKQIRNFVMRDRNHPSIVVWSIGNELLNQPYDKEGASPERVKFMSDFVHKYDPTRPVGMACHIPNTAEQPILDALDLTGWNYARRYAIYRERYPNKPIIYSESASALSTRGFYELPFPTGKTAYSKKLQVNSYDLNSAMWSDIPDVEFQLMEDDSFIAGEFVWTGFDYLGEPTPFSQQARSSYFGIVDLCGIPKDRFYLYRSYWRPDTTTVHILPHWNWPERIGQNVPVFVYTNGDSAELFLNGKSVGRRTKGELPSRPPNFARGKSATASSIEAGNVAANAFDADRNSRWCAATADANQWWQVDLGDERHVKYLTIDFEKEVKNYGYLMKASVDSSEWQTIVTQNTSREPRWGGPTEQFYNVDIQARFLRIEFKELREGAWASIREFGAYPEKVESNYYKPTYKYRLRWNDIVYEPGELKAVAYKDGREIGHAIVRTAGSPAAIQLTADRMQLAATGDDLCYILVEAVDEKGTLCPLTENTVRFKVDGPAEIAGVGNGNPLSLEPFQADFRKLFYGKAMLILRTKEGKSGLINIAAESDGLASANIVVRSR
jgi:beta-galactosidase